VLTLSTQDLAPACRIFLSIAYPDGPATIPPQKRAYEDIGPAADVASYLPPSKNALGVCKDLTKSKVGLQGYEFRLGSATFPHLKLRIQVMDFHGKEVWVYSVDTHDQFHHASQHPTEEEAVRWRSITEQNRKAKYEIEVALASAGFLTPKHLLRLDLTSPIESPI
jgi:hypothetical protein